MQAKYQIYNENSEIENCEIDTNNLDNDSGCEWTEKMLRDYLLECDSSTKNFETI